MRYIEALNAHEFDRMDELIGDHVESVSCGGGGELVRDGLAQPPPQPVLGPRGEPAMGGGRRDTERLRQVPPGTVAGQPVHHSREHRPLINRGRPASLRTGSERRQQQCDE